MLQQGSHVKTAGIVGGIGPESTIEYYRFIIAEYRRQKGNEHSSGIFINSIYNATMLALIGENRLPETVEYLLGELEKLARAGADFGVLAANTPHIVFDALRERSPTPLL